MKPSLLPMLTMVGLLALPSCEKIRSLQEKLGKKPPAKPAASAAPVAPAKPAAPVTPATPYKGEVVSEIAEGGYEAFSQLTGRVIIVDFYADWCGASRELAPLLQNIATEKQGLVLVGKINAEKAKVLAGRMGVTRYPDVRIFRDGKQVDQFVGLPDEATVRKKIESHLKGLPPLSAEAKTEIKKAKTPPIQPMTKDWMPPGIKRR